MLFFLSLRNCKCIVRLGYLLYFLSHLIFMKLKNRKSAGKRVKVKEGFFARKKAYRAHLLKRKNSKRMRRLSEPTKIHVSDASAFSKMLPYG